MAVQALTGTGNVTYGSASSANAVTINKPANVADGDLLIAVLRFQNSGKTIVTPAGWTSIVAQTANWSAAVFYKAIPTASAESATSYSFNVDSGSARWVGMIFRVTGAATSSIIDQTGAWSAATGTASTVAPAVTPTKTGGLLLDILVSNIAQTGGTGVAFTPPSGMTAVGTGLVDNGSQTSQVWAGQEAIGSTASTGTRTVGFSPAAANSQSVLIAVNPGNTPPNLSLTGNQNVSAGASVSATATATDDGSIASYAWTVLASGSTATPTLSGASTATVTLTAPAAGNLVTLQCVVTDDGGLTATKTTEVRVPVTGNTTIVPLALDAGKVGTWTRSGSATTDGAALADASDATYLESGTVSGTAQTATVRLTPANARTNLTVSPGRLSTGADAGTVNVTVELLDGATVRQTWTQAVTSTAATDFTFAVSNPAAIVDWAGLSLRIGATS